MKEDLAHKYPGWFRVKLEELCIGDKFGTSGYSFSCTYMGIFRYSGKDYFVYEILGEPHIIEYGEMKDKVLFIRK